MDLSERTYKPILATTKFNIALVLATFVYLYQPVYQNPSHIMIDAGLAGHVVRWNTALCLQQPQECKMCGEMILSHLMRSIS
jgi:hypothetical protein